MFSKNDDATSHKTFFDDFQTDIQASNPNDDGGEPSGINIGSESDSDDTAKEIMIKNQCRESTRESNTLRRSSRQLKLSVKLNDYVLNSKTRYGLDHTWLSTKNYGFIANVNKIFEPKSCEDAAFDKNWVQAMNEEMNALYENNTWDLVELPRNRRAIGSKCVYKTKLKPTGEIDRYKARLVAKGFTKKSA
ncbi:ribonuclease H-like domain-containing protein [Tanacetum coccineum]